MGLVERAKREARNASMALLTLVLIFLLLKVPSASAQLVNGSFETGDLTGWTAQGNVEALQASNFNPQIPPPEGEYFALISTGPGNSPAPDNGDIDGDGASDNDVTVLSQTFTSEAGGLSFEWSWLTGEEGGVAEVDDFFLVRLDGTIILSGSVAGNPSGCSPFSGVADDDAVYSVTSSGPTSGSNFNDGRSSFQTFSTLIWEGSHTIEFIVADAGDTDVDSGLLVDAFTAPSPNAVGGYMVPVNELAILAPYLALAGLFGAVTVAVAAKRRHKT